MTASKWIVAADVGNSALKLCVGRTDQTDDALIQHSRVIEGPEWQTDAIEWVDDQVASAALAWRIASVNRTAAESLQQEIAEQQPAARVDAVTRHDVPLTIAVDQPDVLGIDRLLGAFAGSNRFGCPLIVVDAGSAVTVDYVSAGAEFAGGAILPGLALQTRVLASGTDALPEVSWNSRPLQSPGRNTTDAIRLGVWLGLAGAVGRIVESYRELARRSSQDCQVVVTGGDAATLAQYFQFPHEIVPNLVCRGLLELPRLGRTQTT